MARRIAVYWFIAILASLCAVAPCPSFAQDSAAEVRLGIGWSHLHIDDTEVTAITDFFVTEVLDHQSNHDGELNGYRLTGEIAGFLPRHYTSWRSNLALKGFYSRYEDSQKSRCAFSGTDTDCVYFPLFDPDLSEGGADISGGFLSDWRTEVDREITHWGAAVEMRFDRNAAPAMSLKDTPPVPAASPFQWRLGLAMRKLDQDMSLESVDLGPTADPVTLDDHLDTVYYGGYAGFSAWRSFGHGYRIGLAGETGLYYSETDYSTRYTATDTLRGPPIDQSLSLKDTAPAFIGSLNVSLEKEVYGATLGLFGEAEWISHVPKVLYNDVDINDDAPFDVTGTQDGTELGDGSAFTYTIGARVSVPLR